MLIIWNELILTTVETTIRQIACKLYSELPVCKVSMTYLSYQGAWVTWSETTNYKKKWTYSKHMYFSRLYFEKFGQMGG